jgi:hypothetical protein
VAKLRSVEEIVARLQEQVEFHGKRESFHAAHEELHREQRSSHAAALEEARRRLEAFQTATTEAVELANRSVVPPKRQGQDLEIEDLGSASRPKVGRMVTLLLKEKGPDERFGAQELYREVNQRFRDHLRRPVDPIQMSVVLRRLQRRGLIHQVRPGRPYKEALYVRERPAEDPR